MDYLAPTLCADGYTDALTLGPSFSCDHANIAVGADTSDSAAVLYQVAEGEPGDWRWTDEREFTAIPQTFAIDRIQGIRFRNKVAGTPATVQCYLAGPKDPDVKPGTPYAAAKIAVEHNDATVAAAATLDLEDSPTIVWTITDDAPNQRIQISGSVTGDIAADSFGTGAFPHYVGAGQGIGIYDGFLIASNNGVILYAAEPGDSWYRFQLDSSGSMYFGTGAAAADTILSRTGNNILQISSASGGGGALDIAGNPGYLAGNLRIGAFPGNTLGFFSANPIAQPIGTLSGAGWVFPQTGTPLTSTSYTSGGVGTRGYTFPDVVACLKNLGLIGS